MYRNSLDPLPDGCLLCGICIYILNDNSELCDERGLRYYNRSKTGYSISIHEMYNRINAFLTIFTFYDLFEEASK